MKRFLLDQARVLKHARGWKSGSRYVAFAVDDYGSVRTANAAALAHLEQRIPGFGGQMDEFDAMETRQDLEALFQTLSRHKDRSGNPCVFTTYCLSANPDFEAIRDERRYVYETLVQTYERLEAEDPASYSGMSDLWREGMTAGTVRPQCHGREHYCIPLINWKLRNGSSDLVANLEVESVAGLVGVEEFPGVGFTQAFGLTDPGQLPEQEKIIEDGLRLFNDYFGFSSTTFVPPAAKFNRALDSFLHGLGVQAVDVPFVERGRSGLRRYLPRLNFLSAPSERRLGKIVRTLSFEPCSGVKSDPVGQALAEIELAFRWKKPVIVSSHRVNYGGHIDADNRLRGLSYLNELIQRILSTWPDVRFVSVDSLIDLMDQSTNQRPSNQ